MVPLADSGFAIVGAGVAAGRLPGHSARALQTEAARLAIEDAGLRRQDIDGCINTGFETGGGAPVAWTDAFPRVLKLPANFYFTVSRGGAMVTLGILAAQQALSLGLARYVCVAFGSNDWSRSHARRAATGQREPHGLDRGGLWGAPLGDLAAASHHTFFASRHMHEYGTTSEQLGWIAVAERRWAGLNPDALMHDRPITIEDHQRSPVFVWPYHLLDMCLVSDGGAAFVITTLDRARDLPGPHVRVLGLGLGEALADLWWKRGNYTRLAVDSAKAAAFGQAGITVGDLDLAELYDCFTGEVLFQLEDYGWCDKGGGGAFVEGGRIGPGGVLPVNTGGGLLSCHYMADWTGMMEALCQLRGRAGARQVPDARLGLVTGHGGEILRPGMCSIHSTLVLARED